MVRADNSDQLTFFFCKALAKLNRALIETDFPASVARFSLTVLCYISSLALFFKDLFFNRSIEQLSNVLNSKIEDRGNKTVLVDPERFPTVRRMWDLMLSGNYSPARIQKIANEEWGYRTRQSKKTGGKPISVSAVYKIFNDPFYYGVFEYPKSTGLWYKGQHEPMVTEAEFHRVQKLLHRNTNPRPHKEFDLPLRGLIKCGECSSSITAHFKEQVRCTSCHYKSSVTKRNAQPHSYMPISKMSLSFQ